MPISIEDLDFLPVDERQTYFDLITKESAAATHITENNGPHWTLPEPNDDIIHQLTQAIFSDVISEKD